MNGVQCAECQQHFSRKDVMLRHRRTKHVKDSKEISHAYPQSTDAYPPPPPPPPPLGTGKYLPPPQSTGTSLSPPPPPPPLGTGKYLPPPQSTGTSLSPPPPPPPPLGTGKYLPPPQSTGTSLSPPPPPPPQGTGTSLSPPPPPPPQGTGISLPMASIEHNDTQWKDKDYSEFKPMTLHHPFTMMISGPTACGKTTFVKELLLNSTTRIKPDIQRIVWLYKRWQPMYTMIQNGVLPKVQFIQGIPCDLEDEDFFDSRINNLLVIDDLFSEAGRDKRITDLFTEGSHHRSLSVIGINQNLFANKDPTQRRNCHYLVLFKTPVDSQSVMTLARQMYPGRSEIFMNRFAKATKQPYSPLLVDLKPFTPEKERLKDNIVWRDENKKLLTNQEPAWSPTSIKEMISHPVSHSSVGFQTVHNESDQRDLSMSDKMNSCDDCGLLFDSAHDVQRHVKRGWCAESQQEPPIKRQKIEDNEDNLSTQEDVEDNEGFLKLWQKAQNHNVERFNKLYDKYIEDGESDEDAKDMAEERVQPYNERCFFQKYAYLIEEYLLPLKDNEIHKTIIKDIEQLTKKGISVTNAVKRVLKKNGKEFQSLFETELSKEEEEEDEEEEEEDSDDETEEESE